MPRRGTITREPGFRVSSELRQDSHRVGSYRDASNCFKQLCKGMAMSNRSLKIIRAGTVALCLTGAFSAHAALVSVTGGFTRFDGYASGTAPSCVPQFKAFVAGALVNAPICNAGPVGDGTFISGPASYTFPSMLRSFEFYETQFGSDLTHNGFSFVPFGPTTVANLGDEFVLGTLTFTNGVWFNRGPVNFFHINLTTSSSDPLFNAKTLSDDLVMDIRLGITPEDNADCISFAHFNVGLLCAYENGVPGKTNTTSALVYGRIGSLIPTRFADVTGGFLIGADVPGVAEPSSLLLLGAGLAACFWRRRTTS